MSAATIDPITYLLLTGQVPAGISTEGLAHLADLHAQNKALPNDVAHVIWDAYADRLGVTEADINEILAQEVRGEIPKLPEDATRPQLIRMAA